MTLPAKARTTRSMDMEDPGNRLVDGD